ncbi:MAG: hypothetical protein ACRD7E_30045 [Bryobacteraceae bacterium]
MSRAQRTTILELHAQGVSKREIERVLGISRLGSAQSPALQLDHHTGVAAAGSVKSVVLPIHGAGRAKDLLATSES